MKFRFKLFDELLIFDLQQGYYKLKKNRETANADANQANLMRDHPTTNHTIFEITGFYPTIGLTRTAPPTSKATTEPPREQRPNPPRGEVHDQAVSSCDAIHRGRRTLLKQETEKMVLFFTDHPSLLALNIQMVFCLGFSSFFAYTDPAVIEPLGSCWMGWTSFVVKSVSILQQFKDMPCRAFHLVNPVFAGGSTLIRTEPLPGGGPSTSCMDLRQVPEGEGKAPKDIIIEFTELDECLVTIVTRTEESAGMN
ncbi:hypothetical protein POM88_047659 [Heracleum sosnowskyi]|uniref:Uncharacterized protein n=1 Tax=Heracleum sosnowskyi TaxID=360622 RepID=A0AAD8GUS6_9APIA|nr:hypothetical protein POM88_047659 [Heracleum sosnowskyi]